MSAQRLYKAEWVTDEDGDEIVDTDTRPWVSAGRYYLEPAGWREYALAKWGAVPPENEYWPQGHKPFFWPSTDRIFRSRSAAQRRVDIINHWGGRAVLVECTPLWETVEHANRRRAQARLRSRVAKKRAELADLEAQLGGAQISGSSIRDMLERIESGIESFDSDHDGSKNFTGLRETSGEVVAIAPFESGIGDVEGSVQIISDRAHGAEPTGGGVA